MRIALINSGLGLLAVGAILHKLRPDAELILASDPDGMPWGPRTPAGIQDRALLCARACAECEPDVMVMACNTGSVHALEVLRAEFEPRIAVIGTVPAIKPAAAAHRAVAIWATVATTESAYQRRLIAEFGGSAEVTPVACPGLADAVDAGDEAAMAAAIASAAARTPAGCQAVVLGCTEYELVGDRIAAAVPGAVTLGSAAAVAAQALRRAEPASPATGVASTASTGTGVASTGVASTASTSTGVTGTGVTGTGTGVASTGVASTGVASAGVKAPTAGSVRVLLSGRPAALPEAAMRYPEGRLLARLVLAPADRDRALSG
jgi:glutamate racemase